MKNAFYRAIKYEYFLKIFSRESDQISLIGKSTRFSIEIKLIFFETNFFIFVDGRIGHIDDKSTQSITKRKKNK